MTSAPPTSTSTHGGPTAAVQGITITLAIAPSEVPRTTNTQVYRVTDARPPAVLNPVPPVVQPVSTMRTLMAP